MHYSKNYSFEDAEELEMSDMDSNNSDEQIEQKTIDKRQKVVLSKSEIDDLTH